MTIKAVYENGVFKPLEPIELENGTEAAVEVKPAPQKPAEVEKWSLGLVQWVADDFDEPLEDFAEYQ